MGRGAYVRNKSGAGGWLAGRWSMRVSGPACPSPPCRRSPPFVVLGRHNQSRNQQQAQDEATRQNSGERIGSSAREMHELRSVCACRFSRCVRRSVGCAVPVLTLLFTLIVVTKTGNLSALATCNLTLAPHTTHR